MPRIKRMIDRMRGELQAKGEAMALVDVGDHMDRFRGETEGSDGGINRAVLAATGYEMITVGNNELLTFSKEELHALYHMAPFDVLAANVTEIDGGCTQWLKPWRVVEKDGWRIGFTGATISYPAFYRQLGWEVADPIVALAQLIPRWRREVDAMVLLSHLGYATDIRIAREISGIDLILGSHTHHLLEQPEHVDGTWIAAAGKFGQYVGHTTLHLEGGRVTGVTGRCLSTAGEAADEALQEQITVLGEAARRQLARPIRQSNHPLAIDWYQESPLGNCLADGLRDWAQTDIALVNAGQLLDGLAAGPVSPGRLHQICPHPINACRVTLTGEQILKTLEESLLPQFQEMVIKGFGFRGKQLGILNLSGLTVGYDPQAPPHERVRQVRVGDKFLAAKERYRVATIDMFTFGVGYSELQKGTNVEYLLPEMLRHILEHWLLQPQAVEMSRKARWLADRKPE